MKLFDALKVQAGDKVIRKYCKSEMRVVNTYYDRTKNSVIFTLQDHFGYKYEEDHKGVKAVEGT